MGQSAWLKTSWGTLQGWAGTVNGARAVAGAKPLIPGNLFILRRTPRRVGAPKRVLIGGQVRLLSTNRDRACLR